MSGNYLLHRKIGSLIITISRLLRTYIFKLKIKVLGFNISIGRGSEIGRMVKMQTFDGGKITIGKRVNISDMVYLEAKYGHLIIGDDTFIGIGCQFVAGNEVVVGKSCAIAAYTVIMDGNHGTGERKPILSQSMILKPVHVGSDVWLGSHVTVTSGVNIGTGSVVGANAVVTRDLPEMVVAVGVPAKPIQSRKGKIC